MPVYRLIFRFDFDLNYEIVDKPGEVMKQFDGLIKKHKFEILENIQDRNITGVFVSDDKKEYREITVSPRSISASIEMTDGISIDKIIVDKRFLLLSDLADALCQKFHINSIRRSGLRLFYFGNKQNTDYFDAYRNLFRKELIDGVEKSLGEIQDYAVHFDGKSDEGIEYHLNSGPLKKDENYTRYLNKIGKNFGEVNSCSHVVDIDLYEKNIALSKITFRNWFKQYFRKANDLVQTIGKNIQN